MNINAKWKRPEEDRGVDGVIKCPDDVAALEPDKAL